jgi:hypothetical protein
LKAKALTDRGWNDKKNLVALCVGPRRNSTEPPAKKYQSASHHPGSLALRIRGKARWSRAHEREKCVAETQVVPKSRVGGAGSLAYTVHRMEFYMARHQNWFARLAASFIRGDSFSDRDHRAASCFDRSHPITAVAP